MLVLNVPFIVMTKVIFSEFSVHDITSCGTSVHEPEQVAVVPWVVVVAGASVVSFVVSRTVDVVATVVCFSAVLGGSV